MSIKNQLDELEENYIHGGLGSDGCLLTLINIIREYFDENEQSIKAATHAHKYSQRRFQNDRRSKSVNRKSD